MLYPLHGLEPWPGQLVQIGLAVYLFAALLIVLAIGAFGVSVLTAVELLGNAWCELFALREKAGREVFR